MLLRALLTRLPAPGPPPPCHPAPCLQTLEKVLTGDGYPEDQVACAPRLMGVILQHCKGRVNDCLGEQCAMSGER